MNIYEIITILLAWYFYAILEGIREAEYVHILDLTSIKFGTFEEHKTWTFQRVIVGYIFLFLLVVGVRFTHYPIISSLLLVTYLPLSFVFVHDGTYYKRMNQLDNKEYPKGFCDFSTTSTSWFDRMKLTTFPLRLTYFTVSLIEIIILLILNKNI